MPPAEKLHETHAALQQTACQQTATSEIRCLRTIQSIQRVSACRLVFDSGDFGDGQLHARGELVTGDARRQRIALAALRQMAAVHGFEQFPRGPVGVVGDRQRGREIVDGIALAADDDALMASGQEAVAPVDRTAGRILAHIRNDHEGGQVVRLAAQAIRQPGAQHRKAVEPEAAVLLEGRRRVVRGLSVHRANDRQLVSHFREMGEQFGHPKSAGAALLEFPVGFTQQTHLTEENIRALACFQRFAVRLDQLRLVVEGVHVAHGADEADVDGTAGARFEVRARIGSLAPRSRRADDAIPKKQTRQGGAAQPVSDPGEELAAIEPSIIGHVGPQST